jgi:hypothetical protein
MRFLGLFACWGLIPLFDLDCRQWAEPPLLTVNDIFSTSFETDADTMGWSGYGAYRFVADAPPGGGSRSLEVAGGCIVPHGVRSIVAPRDGKKIVFAMWGKLMANGGGASLRWSNAAGDGLHLSVTDTVWTRYEASAPIHVMAGDTLRLELMSGGFVYGAMRVDLLEVLLAD